MKEVDSKKTWGKSLLNKVSALTRRSIKRLADKRRRHEGKKDIEDQN